MKRERLGCARRCRAVLGGYGTGARAEERCCYRRSEEEMKRVDAMAEEERHAAVLGHKRRRHWVKPGGRRSVLFVVVKNDLLEFARVIKAREQVVAGTLHHLTVEVIDAGKKKIYEAKVWIKPWLNFKELQEFSHAGDSS
ncbi:hypothetical protein ZIOFF_060370 [Zingiber officinale]|uniref:Cysteine proteinase inhibitor n=1 Tax=Zingiber officinale TaxID=94328 RepID=A0A8J5FBM6_ZINOF|nr:hypothetical protein ZIOFF_060370 [Zingiber officinale]